MYTNQNEMPRPVGQGTADQAHPSSTLTEPVPQEYTTESPESQEIAFSHQFASLPKERRTWVLETMRELLRDVQADELLEQVFPNWTPLDLDTWRPSTLPPGVPTWEAYDYLMQTCQERVNRRRSR